jgi:hypothetical protein
VLPRPDRERVEVWKRKGIVTVCMWVSEYVCVFVSVCVVHLSRSLSVRAEEEERREQGPLLSALLLAETTVSEVKEVTAGAEKLGCSCLW